MDFTPKEYKVRAGTIDSGKEYEVMVATLISLRCLKGSQHFWLAMNMDNCGAFDDVVLYKKNKNMEGTTYLLQLQHQEQPKNIVEEQFFSLKGDFSLQKHSDSFSKLKDVIDGEQEDNDIIRHFKQNPKMKFILFTNKRVSGNFQCLSQLVNLSEFHAIVGHEKSGNVYRFNDAILSGISNIGDFVANLFLFSGQPHMEDMNKEVKNALQDFVLPLKLSERDRNEIFEKFLNFVRQWSRGELGGHYPLYMNHIRSKLIELLLLPYMNHTEYSDVDSNISLNMWRSITDDLRRTIIDETDDVVVEFLNNFVCSTIATYRNDSVAKKLWRTNANSLSKIMLRSIRGSGKISYDDAHQFLWKKEELPLIIEVHDFQSLRQVQGILKLFPGLLKVIILNRTKECRRNMDIEGLFTNFGHLEEDHQEAILELPLKFQGRQSILQDVVNINDTDMFNLITVKDIIYILSNKLNIGDQCNKLPDIFVDISLERVWLEMQVLQDVQKEIFAIRYNSKRDLEMFLDNLEIDKLRISTWENINSNALAEIILFDDVKDLKKIERFISNRRNNQLDHLLVLHDTDKLEWVKSFTSTKNINQFRSAPVNEYLRTAKEKIENISHERNPILISSYPGMGKSVLINYFAQQAPTNFWVLRVNLEEYYTSWATEKLETLNNFVNAILNKNYENVLVAAIFKKYFDSKNVLFLLDGFDEIPVPCRNDAETMIKSIHESGYVVCLTTRPHLKNNLESLLDTFAIALNPFSLTNQTKFLIDYFANYTGQPENLSIKLFVENLLEATRRNLNDLDNTFTGVPLQITLLAIVFTSDCITFIDSGEFLNRKFDLLYLYKIFIKNKFQIACESKYGTVTEDMIHCYKKCRSFYALRLIFPTEDLEKLNIDKMPLYGLQKDGIVVVDSEGTVSFVHRTFAEYLTAEWLWENLDSGHKETVQILTKKIFSLDFTVVHNIFDRMLAQNCPLHLAIINQKFDELKKIISSNSSCVEGDKKNRSIFHLIAGWGLPHPRERSYRIELDVLKKMAAEDKMMTILNMIPPKDIKSETDDLLNGTPLDYAILRGSFNIADVLCARNHTLKPFNPIAEEDLTSIVFYSFELNYTSLLWVIFKYTMSGEFEALSQTKSSDSIMNMFQQPPTHYLLLDQEMKVLKLLFNDVKVPTGNDPYLMTSLETEDNQSADRTICILQIMSDSIKLILIKETRVNAVVGEGNSILYCTKACTTGLLTLQIKPEENDGDHKNMSVLHWATSNGYTETANLFLSLGADVEECDRNDWAALHKAVINGHTETTNLLLSQKANLEAKCGDGETALQKASFKGSAKMVAFLLSKRAQLEAQDNQGETALHKAARNGHNETAELLISEGAQLEAKCDEGETALHKASLHDHAETVKLLLSKGAELEVRNNRKETPLHLAAFSSLATVGVLLSLGAQLEAQNNEGETALHVAAFNGSTGVVSLLLRKAKLESKDSQNWTPLHKATFNGHEDVVNLFITANANIEAKTIEEKTPLHLAAEQGHVEVAKLLLAKGADANGPDKLGKTALIYAAMNLELVKLLLKYDVNIKIQDNDGLNAEQWAIKNEINDVILYLSQL